MNVLDTFVQKCHSVLLSDSSAKIALDYLSKRKLSIDSIKQNKIGFCPDVDLPQEIKYYGKDKEKVDLTKDNGYDWFIKNRVIVPVFSEFGQTVGLATRKPTFKDGNTWWNLPKPFHKGNHLFLLDKVRENVFKKNKIYVVEGYMDALSLLQAGLTEVVALMGTALSPRKIGLIARYCDNICLCLDIDANQSGQKAQDKAIFTLFEFGFCNSLSVIDHLEVGQDPDDYISNNSLSDFLDGERNLKESEIKQICKKIRSTGFKR